MEPTRSNLASQDSEVRGPTKWDDLKEFNDVIDPTYRDACYARGLLKDGKEYIDGLLEASLWGDGGLSAFFLCHAPHDGYYVSSGGCLGKT
uniref:Uncharacterized protein n=1 Tax=Tanacetum cinerariifolium TaxID=118510 RepID=A0A699J2E5_TANCI|nr:hypothetical protein [Tanacetum cinerariifolium]